MAPAPCRFSAVTGFPLRVNPTTMRPNLSLRSARPVAKPRMAITSEAAVMSKPVSRV